MVAPRRPINGAGLAQSDLGRGGWARSERGFGEVSREARGRCGFLRIQPAKRRHRQSAKRAGTEHRLSPPPAAPFASAASARA
ncbi:hypothetical protein [Lysobacter gummosus]|uniref:hypothetical protein n=1 Tax=Lysobacter gummosus TaxID=262324 RepID=UPI0036367F04